MKRLMILGAGVMQGPAIRIAKKMGLEVVAVDGNPAAPNAAAADRFYHIDLKDKEAIAALGASLQRNGGLDGIMTAGTDFSASVAWAAGRLGLPGIPYEAALDASDKERMRRRFRQAGVPSPEFVVYGEEGGGLPPRSECRPERCQAHKVPGTGAPFYASPLSGGDPRNAPLTPPAALFQTPTIEDFWQGFAGAAGCALHIDVLRGRSDHHKIEAIFKAAARALREAASPDPRAPGLLPSTKGLL